MHTVFMNSDISIICTKIFWLCSYEYLCYDNTVQVYPVGKQINNNMRLFHKWKSRTLYISLYCIINLLDYILVHTVYIYCMIQMQYTTIKISDKIRNMFTNEIKSHYTCVYCLNIHTYIHTYLSILENHAIFFLQLACY